MTATEPMLVLASGSPRRLKLLRQIGLDPCVQIANVDETPVAGESPGACVERLARAKADRVRQDWQNVRKYPNAIVLAADTVVVEPVSGELLGKPRDRAHALTMLAALSDRTHQVITGVCLAGIGSATNQPRQVTVQTAVTFSAISAEAAHRYWATGEPEGKAGSYAIQGSGALFVRHLAGSYSNVVGLPLYETAELLRAEGITLPGNTSVAPQ